MPYNYVREFTRMPMGADLDDFQGPAGDAQIYRILEKARTLIEDYIGFSLLFHQVIDETHTIDSSSLPWFPQETPIRAVQSMQLLGWIQGGSRQTWDMAVGPVEGAGRSGSQPMAYGSVKIDRTHQMVTVSSYAGAMGFPWATLGFDYSQLIVTYTAGYDTTQGGASMAILTSTVQSVPSPTSTSFAVATGQGKYVMLGVPITVNGHRASVLAVNGDVVTTATPLGYTPVSGDAVSQSDGVSMPAPQWLKNLELDTARHLVNIVNATAGGATGIGTQRVGGISWTVTPQGSQPDLPDPVKRSLDRHVEQMSLEMA